MSYIGEVNHEQLVEELPGIWRGVPDLEHYNTLIDLRFHSGSLDWNTVKEVNRLWKAHFNEAPPQNFTAIVSKQAGFHTLVKAIQAFAPISRFRAFDNLDPAVDWLASKRDLIVTMDGGLITEGKSDQAEEQQSPYP